MKDVFKALHCDLIYFKKTSCVTCKLTTLIYEKSSEFWGFFNVFWANFVFEGEGKIAYL